MHDSVDLVPPTDWATPKLKLNPPSAGVQWVRQSWQTFVTQPLRFALMFMIFMLLMMVLLGFDALMPRLGLTLFFAALPWVSLAFMLATSVATPSAGSERFSIWLAWLAPWRGGPQRTRALLTLGLLYAVGTLVVLAIGNWVDNGAFEALERALVENTTPQSRERAVAPLLNDPALHLGMLVRGLLITLLSVPFWHAPALTHWYSQSPAKALFFSTMACWRNKGALAMYGLTWMAQTFLIAVVVNVLALVGFPGLAAALISAATMMLFTAMYVSFYFTFAGCFAPGEEFEQTL
jgi:hypothetical protein